MDIIGTLQGTGDGETEFLVVFGDDSVVFDIEVFLRAGSIFAFDDMRGGGPDGVDIALFEMKALDGVVRAPDDLGLGFTFFDGKDGGKRFVVDADGGDGLG